MSILVMHAKLFATAAHGAIGQVRKYTGEPYITHPAAVVDILSRLRSPNEDMLAAAWLHDVVEDTRITIEMIQVEFPSHVARLVEALTNVPLSAGNRRARFLINKARLADTMPTAQTIKVADLIHNTSSIVTHDPKFAVLYLEEKLEILEILKGADEGLRLRAFEQVFDAKRKLALMAPIVMREVDHNEIARMQVEGV